MPNRALAQIKELWQYSGEDELPPDSLLQVQVEALRILRIDVPLRMDLRSVRAETLYSGARYLDRQPPAPSAENSLPEPESEFAL